MTYALVRDVSLWLARSCPTRVLGLVFRQHQDSHQDSHQSSIKPQTPRCGVRRRSHRRSHCRTESGRLQSDLRRRYVGEALRPRLHRILGRRLECPRVHDCGRKGSRDALRTPPRLQPVLLAYHSDVSDAAGAAPHAHVWKGLYIVVMTLGKALSLMSNLFLLMLMVMLIFALMDMQLLLVVSSTASRSSHGCTSTHSCPPCLLSSSS